MNEEHALYFLLAESQAVAGNTASRHGDIVSWYDVDESNLVYATPVAEITTSALEAALHRLLSFRIKERAAAREDELDALDSVPVFAIVFCGRVKNDQLWMLESYNLDYYEVRV